MQVHLKFSTRGAAETLFVVLQSMNNVELSRRTISLDCDTFYFSNILDTFRSMPEGQGCCCYFVDTGDAPIFSYIAMNEQGRIQDIAEKVAISRNANTGAYGFASAALLRKYLVEVLDKSVPSSGEYYTSAVIGKMIRDDCDFRGLFVSDFACVGTRPQLEEFYEVVKKRPYLVTPRRFCFDLDNTLVSYPTVKGDYSSVLPIEKNIKMVRDLKTMGHTVIVYTARRMKTHKGNIGSIAKDVGMVTIDTLDKFGIPYDEIVFGKPYAHVYVDDLAVHSALDTEKELGWGVGKDEIATKFTEKSSGRTFCSIQFLQNSVIKSSNEKALLGELHFYKSMPQSIRHLFPKLLDHSKTGDNGKTTNIIMEFINSVTVSRLLTAGAVTKGRLTKVLTALNQIHSCEISEKDLAPNKSNAKVETNPKEPPNTKGKPSADTKPKINGDSKSEENGYPLSKEAPPKLATLEKNYPEIRKSTERLAGVDNNQPGVDFHANYTRKVSTRYTDHAKLYESVGVTSEFANKMLSALDQYVESSRSVIVPVIHGNPVFTNIMIEPNGDHKFCDMRGRIDEHLTISGDVAYDLGKVYQSLTGYDFILHDIIPSPRILSSGKELRKCFRDFVAKHYSVLFTDVLLITSSMYMSLIPLHSKYDHQVKFAKKAIELFQKFESSTSNPAAHP